MTESALSKHKLYYEDMAPRKITRNTGGKDSKMSKSSKVTAAPKEAKSYNKTRGEHLKDIVIAILIVGVAAFAAGVHYANNQNATTQSAVKNALSAQTASAEAKK